MRILAVSDLHYSLKQLDWVAAHSSDYQLVVVAGDSLDVAGIVPLEAQSVVILEYLSLVRTSASLAVGSGNHDLTGPDGNGEQAALWLGAASTPGVATDGQSLDLDGLLVTVCPWWDGPVGRAAVVAQLATDAGRRSGRRWMWVYHWPPLGSTTCWTGSRDYGDSDLVDWIAEYGPDIVLTGHVHQSPFVDRGSWVDRCGRTWVFNAGNQRGPVPARIELDLTGHTASWISQMGTEVIDLDSEVVPARSAM